MQWRHEVLPASPQPSAVGWVVGFIKFLGSGGVPRRWNA